MSAPVVKGWCPGAHRPMMSGDGLVVRVRPFRAELTAAQVLALCDIAEEFGNGMLDLTSRANLQIRGVAEAAYLDLLARLDAIGVIDADPAVEGHRNILMPATWKAGDLTDRLYEALLGILPRLPDLPGKMGFAIDTADTACLGEGSADFRFELDGAGGLILRLDGSARGRAIPEAEAMPALLEMAQWFDQTAGQDHGRMARHLLHTSVPEGWATATPRVCGGVPDPGPCGADTVLGAPFGRLTGHDLRALIHGATGIRLMIGRRFLLKDKHVDAADGFVTVPSRLMRVHACPGAPFCPQATVETMALARRVAQQTDLELHVSGCAKGCAHPRPAALTMVGRDGQFDLVTDGRPWDAARHRGLDPSRLNDLEKLN